MKLLLEYISEQLKKFLTPNHRLLSVEIVTNRLLLKPVSMIYKEDIFREFTEEITTYMYPQPPKEVSDTESFINDSLFEIKKEQSLVLVILKRNTQEFLGCVGIHNINRRNPELGIWLKKSVHGNGYGLETINALKKWADGNLDYEVLVYPVERENIRSRRIPERLGGTIFREFDKINLSGKVLHILEFRIPKK